MRSPRTDVIRVVADLARGMNSGGVSHGFAGSSRREREAASGATSPRRSLREPSRRLLTWALSISALAHLALTPFAGLLGLMAWLFTCGALLFAPLGARAMVEQLPQLTLRGWLFVAYILVMPTIVAYWPGNVARIQSRTSRMNGDDRMTSAETTTASRKRNPATSGLYHS